MDQPSTGRHAQHADAAPVGGHDAGRAPSADLTGALAALWTRHRASNIERVARLEAAAAGTLRDALDEATRDAAEQAAHKLAGTLGTFGIADGTDLARRAETMLRDGPRDPQTLAEVVVALRAAVVAGPPAPVTPPDDRPADERDDGPADERYGGPADRPADDSAAPRRAAVAIVATADTALAGRLRAHMSALDWSPVVTPGPAAALAALTRAGPGTVPAVVVVDLPAGDLAREVPPIVAELSATAPTVVLTDCAALADGARPGRARLAAVRAGVAGVIDRAESASSIVAFAAGIAQTGPSAPVTVLALRADPRFDHLYRQAPPECRIVAVTDRSRWWDELERSQPDVVIVEAEPKADRRLGRTRRSQRQRKDAPAGPLEVCRMLRGAPRWSSTPVIVLDRGVRRRGGTSGAGAAVAAGVDDLIIDPVSAVDLYTRVSARAARRAALASRHPAQGRHGTAPAVDAGPPAAPSSAGAAAPGPVRAAAPDVEEAGDTVDVVIVEDDDSVADVVEYALRLRKLRSYRITNGTDAVALLSAGPLRARLILLDVGLPGLDGFAVLGRLRDAGALARTPVIMLTARSSETETLAALGLGAAEHIAKPFSVPILVNRIEHALRRSPR